MQGRGDVVQSRDSAKRLGLRRARCTGVVLDANSKTNGFQRDIRVGRKAFQRLIRLQLLQRHAFAPGAQLGRMNGGGRDDGEEGEESKDEEAATGGHGTRSEVVDLEKSGKERKPTRSYTADGDEGIAENGQREVRCPTSATSLPTVTREGAVTSEVDVGFAARACQGAKSQVVGIGQMVARGRAEQFSSRKGRRAAIQVTNIEHRPQESPTLAASTTTIISASPRSSACQERLRSRLSCGR